mmetsp:Transcript_3358/g.5609  ORF Transcript_3358/g.5609 Transcript_3358/m.5609 type:complete len:218 (-) Transcript_3358:211-864(-)
MFPGLKREMLPTIGVVPKINADFREGNIQQQNIDANLSFDQILTLVASTVGKSDELEGMSSQKKKASTKKRTFGEIQSRADFETRCLDHQKGCAIALIPAMTLIDYEEANFNQHIETLKGLDEDAKTQPIFYSWVNVTCYPEWLKFFDVDPFQIPTVVFYYPEKELQANLIGKFEKESIEDHQERYLRGKLPTFKPRTKPQHMTVESKDCQRGLEEE